MAADPDALRGPSRSRLVPWTRLTRGIGVACDGRKLILAAFGLILLNIGWDGLDQVFSDSRSVTPPVWRPLEFAYPASPEKFRQDLLSIPWTLTEPARFLVRPFLVVFSVKSDGRTFLHALLGAIWGAAVWGIIGGAISRIAVVQVARGERLSLGKALRFALRKTVPLVFGPLSPLLLVAILTLFCALFGLVYQIPTRIAPVVSGILLFLPLFAGLLMTLILIGLAVGWPLIHTTVAAEDEDGFDALSRSYAYVHQRPGQYALALALCWLFGIVGLAFVEVFARLVVLLTHWGLSFAAPQGLLGGLFGTAPVVVDPAAATVHAFWLFLVGLIVHGWIYSYFWTSASLIYLLLRQDVDGTPWNQVASPEPENEPSLNVRATTPSHSEAVVTATD